MESLFNYASDEDNDNSLTERKDEVKAEQDTNYDHITMEMSEDSTSNHELTSSRSVSVESHASNSSYGHRISKAEVQTPSKRAFVSSGGGRSRSRSHDAPRNRDRSYDRRRKYSRDDREKDKERGREREDRSRHRRSRSPTYRHDRCRRSRSPRERSIKYSRREHSPNRRHRDRDRSPRRSCFERKPSKLSILEKLGIELKLPEGVDKDCTGLPSYYNPVAMNPVKYAEQMAKRKLLWSNTSKQAKDGNEERREGNYSKGNLWQGATFSQDQDGKITAKFQRLMGIKQAPQGETSTSAIPETKTGKDLIKKQEELFSSMELQYEVARAATHTQRGVGLGFGVHHYPR